MYEINVTRLCLIVLICICMHDCLFTGGQHVLHGLGTLVSD